MSISSVHAVRNIPASLWNNCRLFPIFSSKSPTHGRRWSIFSNIWKVGCCEKKIVIKVNVTSVLSFFSWELLSQDNHSRIHLMTWKCKMRRKTIPKIWTQEVYRNLNITNNNMIFFALQGMCNLNADLLLDVTGLLLLSFRFQWQWQRHSIVAKTKEHVWLWKTPRRPCVAGASFLRRHRTARPGSLCRPPRPARLLPWPVRRRDLEYVMPHSRTGLREAVHHDGDDDGTDLRGKGEVMR